MTADKEPLQGPDLRFVRTTSTEDTFNIVPVGAVSFSECTAM